MKKTLFSIAILLPIIGMTHSAFALTSCVPGDSFDVNTGKSCVVAIGCNIGDLFNIYTGKSCIAPIVATTTVSVPAIVSNSNDIKSYYEKREEILNGKIGNDVVSNSENLLQEMDSYNNNGCDVASNYDILTGKACISTLPTNPTSDDKEARIAEITYVLIPSLNIPIRRSTNLLAYSNNVSQITILQNELTQLEATSTNR